MLPVSRETVLDNYSDLMTACFAQTSDLPAHELIEVGLADLEADPLQSTGDASTGNWICRLSRRRGLTSAPISTSLASSQRIASR